MRPGDVSETEFIDLSSQWQPTDKLSFDGELGFTYGLGNTPVSEVPETQGGNGGSYQFNGVTRPATVSFADINTADPSTAFLGFAFGDINHTIDKETYVQLNGLFKVDSDIFQSIKAGFRFASHEREDNYIEKPGCAICTTPYPALPAYTGGEYPSNYRGSIDGGGGFAGNIYTYSDAAILNWASTALSHGFKRYNWPGAYDVKENDAAFYVMANIGGDHWSGNFGVRFANTLEEVLSNVGGGPNAITGSLFGAFTPTEIDNHYFDVLPSVNLKFDLAENLSLHFSAAETMARPDYSALGGSVALTDLNDTAAGGNPNLKPVRAADYDTTLAWYYAPQSLLELGLCSTWICRRTWTSERIPHRSSIRRTVISRPTRSRHHSTRPRRSREWSWAGRSRWCSGSAHWPTSRTLMGPRARARPWSAIRSTPTTSGDTSSVGASERISTIPSGRTTWWDWITARWRMRTIGATWTPQPPTISRRTWR